MKVVRTRSVDIYTVWEWKHGVSCYFHVWKGPGQKIYHTHAFNALVLVLGTYVEDIYSSSFPRRYSWCMRFVSRCLNHRMSQAEPGTCSLVLAGPWADTWTETFNDRVITFGWGREVIR